MPVLRASNRKLHLSNVSEDWSRDFSFIQAADCQLGMEWSCSGTGGYGQNKGYEPHYDDCTWHHEMRWCMSFVDMVNGMQPQPKFVVICGDILDAWPQKWPAVRDKQYNDFQKIFSNLKVPLVCVCGNHDVGNSPTPQSVAKYRSDFGDDWFTFVCDGMLCIVLNSQYYEDFQYVPDIAAEQEKWLDKQLAAASQYQHTVVFQHIPWFLDTPNEPKLYYNFPQPLRERMLRKFADAGVAKIFCGHYHRNGGGWYNASMEVVVTSALGLQQGTDRNGFREVNVSRSGITHRYINISSIDP